MCGKFHGIEAWKQVDQFILGPWLAIVTDRLRHVTTLTLRALSYKPDRREVISQGPFGLYYSNCLFKLSCAKGMRFIFT